MKKLLLLGIALALLPGCSFNIFAARKDPFYTLVLRKDPDQSFALYAQGQMLLEQGRFADAEPFFAKLTRVDPTHAGGWLRLGHCALELEQYGKAERAFARATELNHSAEARLGFALANLMQGDVATAKKEADTLRSQLEDSADLMNLYGDIAIIEGRYEQALDYYRQSISLNSSQPAIAKRAMDLESFLANR